MNKKICLYEAVALFCLRFIEETIFAGILFVFVAQSVARYTSNPKVPGSIPGGVIPPKKFDGCFNSYFFGTLRGSTLRFERSFSWCTTLYLNSIGRGV